MEMPSTFVLITGTLSIVYGTAILSYLSPTFRVAANFVYATTVSVVVHVYVGLEAVLYLCLRSSIKVLEWLLFPWAEPKQERSMRLNMNAALSYNDWLLYAKALDKLQGRDDPTKNKLVQAESHNWTHIRELVDTLKQARDSNNILLAAALVQQCGKRNVEGVLDESLYAETHAGQPPDIVTELIDNVEATMKWLTEKSTVRDPKSSRPGSNSIAEDAKIMEAYQAIMSLATIQSTDTVAAEGNKAHHSRNNQQHVSSVKKRRSSIVLPESTTPTAAIGSAMLAEEMKRSLHRLRVSYGRTALCLSGGAGLGYLHAGHVLGLLETNCLPNIISGSSAGALFAAAICTKTDAELIEYFQPAHVYQAIKPFSKPWLQRFIDFFKEGCMFPAEAFLTPIKAAIGRNCPEDDDMTFEEAFQKTGRVLCVTLSPVARQSPPIVLNHLTAPQVVISSAVVSSCAVPGLVPAMRLRYKDKQGRIHDYEGEHQEYIDGSIKNDIPTEILAEMLNVQFFIVAQVNPHVLPFYNGGAVGNPSTWGVHSKRGGFLLAALEFFLKVDMQSKFLFLDQFGVASNLTRSMTQLFGGSCTLISDYTAMDILQVLNNPCPAKVESMFQRGAIAAYRNATRIRTHFKVADAIEACLVQLDPDLQFTIPSERPVIILRDKKILKPSAPPPETCHVGGSGSNSNNKKIKKRSEHESFFSSVQP